MRIGRWIGRWIESAGGDRTRGRAPADNSIRTARRPTMRIIARAGEAEPMLATTNRRTIVMPVAVAMMMIASVVIAPTTAHAAGEAIVDPETPGGSSGTTPPAGTLPGAVSTSKEGNPAPPDDPTL